MAESKTMDTDSPARRRLRFWSTVLIVAGVVCFLLAAASVAIVGGGIYWAVAETQGDPHAELDPDAKTGLNVAILGGAVIVPLLNLGILALFGGICVRVIGGSMLDHQAKQSRPHVENESA